MVLPLLEAQCATNTTAGYTPARAATRLADLDGLIPPDQSQAPRMDHKKGTSGEWKVRGQRSVGEQKETSDRQRKAGTNLQAISFTLSDLLSKQIPSHENRRRTPRGPLVRNASQAVPRAAVTIT